MTDFRCDECGRKLDPRLFPDGQIETACEECDPLYCLTVPENESHKCEHLTRNVSSDKVWVFPPFRCPGCGAGGERLEKFSKKSNNCLNCGFSYPVYD